MSCHYRIRKRIIEGEPWFDIVEWYGSKAKGKGSWTTDSIAPGAETKEDLIQELETMLADAKKHSVFTDKEND